MIVPVLRLIAHFRSSAFAEDLVYLDRYDPLAAEQLRHAIIGTLNDNFSSLGITPSRTEMFVQESFIAGGLSLPEMLEHVELYAFTVLLRSPD